MRYVAASTLLALVAGGLFLVRPPFVASLDHKVFDVLTEWAGPGRPSGRVVIVEVDEKSLARLGRWPWRRDLLGSLVRRLLDRGATTVVLDMMFPEEDRGASLGPRGDVHGRPSGATHDDALAAALSGKPVVIGYTFGFEGGPEPPSRCDPPVLPLALAGPDGGAGRVFSRATGVICSVGAIARAAAGSGFLNAGPDSDGIMRRVPLVIEYENQHYASLALAALRVYRPISTMVLTADAGGAKQLRLDGRSVSLEGPSLLRLRFRGPPRSFASISAVDVLDNRVSQEALDGKIVVVGASAPGIQDMVPTPVSPFLPGSELQATAIDNLLQGDSFSRPLSAHAWELALVLVAAAGSALLLVFLHGMWVPLVTAAVMAAAWAACAVALSRGSVLVSPLPASVAVACNYSFLMLFNYVREKRRADRTEQQLVATRRLAQTALRESEDRYRRLVENVNDAIIVHDVEGRLVFANRRFREWFGVGDRDIREVILENYVAPPWRPAVRERHARLVRGEKVPGNIEFDGLRGDGTRLWIEALVTTLEEDGRIGGTQWALRDVTERKRIEAQSLQSQKMESLGRLAGGVAHDFNNLLTIINGYSDILVSQPERDEETRECLQQIRNAGIRAAELTQKLLAFSRQQVAHLKAFDLNQLVAEATGMYGRLMGEDIELITQLSPTLGLVKADPIQVNQILMNLVANARDAMPEGGRLTIETKNVELDEEFADRYPGISPGSYVYLGVTDTGIGMSAETKQHLFEPFFTTKEPGKGTGLGLASVHGIVRQNGGCIGVSSEFGKGAAFHIYLPRTYDDSPLGEERASPGPLRGSETVLLVEDQDDVRHFLRVVLERCGYRVLHAGNGPEAIALAEEYPGAIHLLLSDVVLPQMRGLVLAERLKRARPEMKVLFISGYPAKVDPHAGPDTSVDYLQKPFPPDVLAAKVREALAN